MTTPDPRDRSVLIVGASAGGLATAEALRRLGHRGRLTFVESGTHLPYDRPPLSKQFLSGEWERERVALRDDAVLGQLQAHFLLGERAMALETVTRTVETDLWRSLTADAVVIATGVDARWLPGAQDLFGVHTLRSLDDAVALRGRLERRGPLVVVGNGVLGSEIAATAAQRGTETTLVGSSATPMEGSLGRIASSVLARRHEEAGVRLIGTTRVSALRGRSGRVQVVELADGTELEAATVVIAIGSEPQTSWLDDSGLTIDDGVVCDEYCRAGEGIWAVGDVARWQHIGLGERLRLENRTNASEQGLAVARDILGEGAPYTPLPYFWSDQYGQRIQVYGSMLGADHVALADGSLEEGRFVLEASRDGEPAGVLGWAMPKQARQRTRPLHDRIKARSASALRPAD